MKKTTRLLALVLSLVMIATSLSVASFAVAPVIDDDCLPTIVIPGLFQSETQYYENDKVALDSNGQPYKMPFFMDSTTDIVISAVSEALIPIASLLVKQEDKDEKAAYALADVLGDVLFSKQQLDETGHFINDIRATKYENSFDKLSKHDRDSILDHFPMQYYMENAGEDKLFVFSYASLDNMIDIANSLYDYIQFVKKYSGYDQVNIVPVSQGGSVANALLQIYADKGISVSDDINRIVYVVPALNGSTLVGEVFEYGIIDDDHELYRDLLPALLGSDDFTNELVNLVLRLMPKADLNNILDVAVDELVNNYLRYSTALWGLCPTENYPGAREKYLTDDSTSQIVVQTDWYNQAALNSDANILNAIEDGVEVFDIVDYNVPLYHVVDSWDDVQADGIIQVDSTSMGAFSLGVDTPLPEDYVPTHSNCTDPENHDHTDPNGIMDVCTGLLPEHTFYFYGQNHEQTASNDVIMKLASTLLFDSTFTSVHSYPDKFPQFNNARNTKKLMQRINEMKNYDTSTLPATYTAELQGAIAQAEMMLDNTVIDIDEVEAAQTRFNNIYNVIKDYEATGGEETPDDTVTNKENTAYLDFSYVLKDLVVILSKLLYIFCGGGGFSDIFG